MIHNRSIFIALVLALFVAARAQVPSSVQKNAEPVNGTIDGQVVNESGQPLAGAAVFVRVLNGMSARSTTTDDDGHFKVKGLAAGLYIVSANSPAYTTLPAGPDGPTYYRIGDSARVELVRGGVITGTVTNATGEPVIAVRVRATLIRDAKEQPPRAIFFGAEQPTDDRGIYRIYGLQPGTYIVSAGATSFATSFYPFGSDVPTFAPSSTRDTAAEVSVRSGEDSAIDIRYRGEPGHSISGSVKVAGTGNASISLMKPDSATLIANVLQFPGAPGFLMSGLSDGDYDLVASETFVAPASVFPVIAYSEPKRIRIKGADVTGIELVPRPFGLINGKLVLQPLKVPECEGKHPPLLAETLVRFRRSEKDAEKDPLTQRMITGTTSPDATGVFVLRNLAQGRYQFETTFYARYWYLQSITMNTAGAKALKMDAAANWTLLRHGEQLSNLSITLAEGASSLHGVVPVAEGTALPESMVVYLVPNDLDKVDDVLRYFVTDIAADGKFTFNNLPPGRYLALTQTNVDAQIATPVKLRQPEAATARVKLRRTAETKKAEIDLKPCQNRSDYKLKP
jgi:hypothetical protein